MARQLERSQSHQKNTDLLSPIETSLPLQRPETIAFSSDRIVLITGITHPQLAREVAEELTKLTEQNGQPITVAETVSVFANGEHKIKIPTNLRNRHVFILDSTGGQHPGDSIMDIRFMGAAAKRASAREVTAIIPHFAYARGDKKDEPRVSIPAAEVAEVIGQRVDRIITMDIHADQEQGFFPGPWDNLPALTAFLPVLQQELPPNIVVVSPDAGGMKRAEKYADKLDARIASIYKRRDQTVSNKSEALGLMGDVKDQDVLIVDDMIDTAGSLCNAAELLKKHGARRIFVAATHGLFSDKAHQRIINSPIERVFVTNTLPQQEDNPKITVVSIAPMLAKAIWCTETGESISENLIK